MAAPPPILGRISKHDEAQAEPTLGWNANALVRDPHYADDDSLHLSGNQDFGTYVQNTDFTESGKVRRHPFRGNPAWDPKQVKKSEDDESWAGLRDPADLHRRWPELWRTMALVTPLLLAARKRHPELKGLQATFGESPKKAPAPDHLIARLRAEVGEALGLTAGEPERRHQTSPWRYNLVSRIQSLSGDKDVSIQSWLKDGPPMGIRQHISSGCGSFPALESPASISPKDVLAQEERPNHKSLQDLAGEKTPPGHRVIEEHMNRGFGLLFADRASAERFLESEFATAPLGTVSKLKPDGSWKRRVILDLRINSVNDACHTPERQVLPTVFNHGRDLALLSSWRAEGGAEDQLIQTMVLDIEDAFMGIPLSHKEWPFNACVSDMPLHRTRAKLHPHEPNSGHYIIWMVLGFGGKSNPLVFSRCIAFAARSAQAMLRPEPGALGASEAGIARLHTYVDDPTLVTLGTAAENSTSVDLVVLWWCILGLPLALKKGTFESGDHKWIGAIFSVRSGVFGWESVIRVPQQFADDLFQMLEPLCGRRRSRLRERRRADPRQGGPSVLHCPCMPTFRHRAVGRTCGRSQGCTGRKAVSSTRTLASEKVPPRSCVDPNTA